jgi:ubiquitin-protein ligase
MSDFIRQGFLIDQFRQAVGITRASDLVRVLPAAGDPPDRYLALFRCRSLVREEDGAIHPHDDFTFGICFPEDYQRTVQPRLVVSAAPPWNLWHPNITYGAPFICLGHLVPGTQLEDIVQQIFDVLTFHKCSPHDPLNEAAAEWVRNHREQLPLDRRPMRRPKSSPEGIA